MVNYFLHTGGGHVSGKVLICPNLSVKSFFPIGKDQRQTRSWITKKYIQLKYTNLPIVVLDDYYVGKRVLSICKASAAVSIANLFSFCNVNFMRRVCVPQWDKIWLYPQHYSNLLLFVCDDNSFIDDSKSSIGYFPCLIC